MRQRQRSENILEDMPGVQGDIARAALKDAFGARPIETATAVPGGITAALILRVRVGGQDCLLRVEGEPSPLRNPHQYASLRIASEAGIAPKIHLLDEANRVVVMDFIEPRALGSYPGGLGGLAAAIGELLKRLQGAPVFPSFVHYPDIVGRLFAHVRRTNLFAEGLLDVHLEHFDLLRRSYDAGLEQLVSSHNDAHSGNFIFDGRRLWLIDWETAYRNDPMVDFATLVDSFGFTPDLEAALAERWLGRMPDAAFYVRLTTVRALTRLYFAGVFLSSSAASQTRVAPDRDLSAPSVEAFDRKFGGAPIQAPDRMHALGKMYLASFLSGDAVPRFGAAT